MSDWWLSDCCVGVMIAASPLLVVDFGETDPFTGEEIVWPGPRVYWSNGSISDGGGIEAADLRLAIAVLVPRETDTLRSLLNAVDAVCRQIVDANGNLAADVDHDIGLGDLLAAHNAHINPQTGDNPANDDYRTPTQEGEHS